MTTLNIRIDEKVKKEARRTLASLGMDTSTAVKIFLNQVIVDQGFPFVPKRSSKEIRLGWDAEIEEARKEKSYKTARQAVRSTLK
ncbi:MAG: type II toxin-antitoxin system RelB/DinJ family antitoxin [archaeon]|nr:type II toxin-antitoxin system RelB/DinJ family antitoxin [archaeon]